MMGDVCKGRVDDQAMKRDDVEERDGLERKAWQREGSSEPSTR